MTQVFIKVNSWKQFSRPSINFDNITGFDKKSIDVPIGRLFGKETL